MLRFPTCPWEAGDAFHLVGGLARNPCHLHSIFYGRPGTALLLLDKGEEQLGAWVIAPSLTITGYPPQAIMGSFGGLM